MLPSAQQPPDLPQKPTMCQLLGSTKGTRPAAPSHLPFPTHHCLSKAAASGATQKIH